MMHKDVLYLIFQEFEDGHDMLNFSEISQKCHQIFCRQIKIVHIPETHINEKRIFMANRKDQQHGIYRTWWSNGKLWYDINYHHGMVHGLSHIWNQWGQMTAETAYQYGLMHGIHRAWCPNTPSLWLEENYYQHTRHGIRRVWKNNGQLDSVEDYHHGTRIEK